MQVFAPAEPANGRAAQPQAAPPVSVAGSLVAYFNAVDTIVNVVVKAVPVACTTAMMATEIPAAIRPYSIAVAPD